MTQAADIAASSPWRSIFRTPAAVSEIPVNCQLDPSY